MFAASQTSAPQEKMTVAQAAAPSAHPRVIGEKGQVQEPSTGPKTEVTRSGRVITPPADVAAPPADAQRTPSGLAMKVLTAGTGSEHPLTNDCVTLSFTSWKTDGTLFSTSTAMNDADVLCLSTAVMGVAEALDQIPRNGASTVERFREALAMFDEGVALQRLNFRRKHPQLSEHELDQILERWLQLQPT